MTVQLCGEDFLYGEGPAFAMIRKRGTSLFQPADHGLELGRPVSSACWNCMHCTYRVADGALTLDELAIVLREDQIPAIQQGMGPLLFGRRPEYKQSIASNARYTGLKGLVAFSGGLLLGREPASQVQWPFHLSHPWAYTHLHELIFEKGVLVTADDHSKAMRRIRKDVKKQPPQLISRNPEIHLRLAETFRLTY